MDSLSKGRDLFTALFITWWSGWAMELLWVFFYPLLGLDRSSSTNSSIFLPEDLCLAARQCSESQICESLIHPHVLLWNPTTLPVTSQPGDFCFPFSRLLPEQGGAVIWEGSCCLNRLSTYLPVSGLSSSQLPEVHGAATSQAWWGLCRINWVASQFFSLA